MKRSGDARKKNRRTEDCKKKVAALDKKASRRSQKYEVEVRPNEEVNKPRR